MSMTETLPPRSSMKERQRQMREDAILDAAIDFLQTKGFNTMTLDDITESIGISRPTLYQHFGSKEEMVLNVVIRHLRRGIERLRSLDESKPPLDRLMEFLDFAMESRFGSCRCIFTDLNQVLQAPKEKSEVYQTLYADFKSRFAGLIEEAQARGDVRSDIRAPLLAEMVMSLYKSPGFDDLVQKGQSCPEEVRACIYNLLKA